MTLFDNPPRWTKEPGFSGGITGSRGVCGAVWWHFTLPEARVQEGA